MFRNLFGQSVDQEDNLDPKTGKRKKSGHVDRGAQERRFYETLQADANLTLVQNKLPESDFVISGRRQPRDRDNPDDVREQKLRENVDRGGKER